jgi:hypothetical protein
LKKHDKLPVLTPGTLVGRRSVFRKCSQLGSMTF